LGLAFCGSKLLGNNLSSLFKILACGAKESWGVALRLWCGNILFVLFLLYFFLFLVFLFFLRGLL